jgi:hypothetical protein
MKTKIFLATAILLILPAVIFAQDSHAQQENNLNVIKVGTVRITITNSNCGTCWVECPNLAIGTKIFVSAHATEGGQPPDRHGPFYCALTSNRDSGGFSIIVYDIGENSFTTTVIVDYLIIG